MKWPLFIQILIFTGVLLIGIIFYVQTFSNFSVTSRTTTGITASIFPDNEDKMKLNDFIMDLNCKEKIIDLRFNFAYIETGNYSFSFTLPYRITNLEAYSGNWSLKNASSGSIVIANYYAIKNESDIGWDFSTVSALIHLQDSMIDTVFETCTVNIPFGGGLTQDVAIAREQLLGNSTMTLIGGGYNGTLIIDISPQNSIITAYTLPLDRIDEGAGYKVLTFQVNGFTPFQLQYVVVLKQKGCL